MLPIPLNLAAVLGLLRGDRAEPLSARCESSADAVGHNTNLPVLSRGLLLPCVTVIWRCWHLFEHKTARRSDTYVVDRG